MSLKSTQRKEKDRRNLKKCFSKNFHNHEFPRNIKIEIIPQKIIHISLSSIGSGIDYPFRFYIKLLIPNSIKYNTSLFKFLLLIFFLTIIQDIFSQKDSIAENCFFVHNYYQVSNDFLNRHKTISKSESKFIRESTMYSNRLINPKYLDYNPARDKKRLLYDTGLYVGGVIISFGILWVLPEDISNWDKDKIREEGFTEKWKQNVKSGPIWDEDAFYLNYVLHPWIGAIYYMSARGSGFKIWESFAYSAFMSTFFWEYGVEAFAEIPSWQDLIITPVAGSILGELFFVWKGNIIKNEKKVLNSRFLGGASLFLMDPFNQIIDGLGYKTKNKDQSSSAVMPIGYNFTSKKTIWGLQIVINF